MVSLRSKRELSGDVAVRCPTIGPDAFRPRQDYAVRARPSVLSRVDSAGFELANRGPKRITQR
ncbi:hypothetical protein IFM12275_59710 [Nocardia sputorum]|nr:hypothetical protein IFM12275_59710 [Nocardia sputorum]